MTDKIKNILNKDTEKMTLNEKLKLINYVYAEVDEDVAAQSMTGMLTDENVYTSDMVKEISIVYTAYKSDDYRAGFDMACKVLLWKNVTEMMATIINNSEEEVSEEIKNLIQKKDLTLEEKMELIDYVYMKIDDDIAAQSMTEMLTDGNVYTNGMVYDISENYTADKSDDYRAGFDKACIILLWKNVPEIMKQIIENSEEE